MKRLIFILLISFTSGVAYSQELNHYTAVNGLSGTDVTAICENENYLWIATNDGLNRFDGKKFEVYRKDNSENSITENNIETLMFDSRGLLWIGFKTGGLDIFDPRGNKFTHISKIIDEYPQRVISIYEDSRNNIWLGSWEDGLYQLEPDGDGELSYKVSKHYPYSIISGIIEKPEGKLWVGTYFGYYLYDIKKREGIKINENSFAITQFLDTGEKNSLWYSAWSSGMHKLEWNDEITVVTEKNISGNTGDVYRIFPMGDNRFYLGTWGDGAKALNLQSQASFNPPPINAPVIMSFFRDRFNKIWIGTYGSGLYSLNNESTGITNIYPISGNSSSAAYTLHYIGNNLLLIGTLGDGLFLYDLKNRAIFPAKVDKGENLFYKYILSIYKDDEVIIAGNDDMGILYVPIKGEMNKSLSLKKFRAENNFGKITSIFKDSKSQFWIGTKQFGLVSMSYDKHNETFKDYFHHQSFGMDEITGFAESSDGQIWVSSHSGIYLLNPQSNNAQKYGQNNSEIIYSLVDDKKNKRLWLGTSDGLRVLYYSGENLIENPFSSEMLPKGAIRNVILDDDCNLWFSISNRIFYYAEKNKEIKEINPGISNNQVWFSSSGCEIDNKQYIIFGGTDNLLLIDPQSALNKPNNSKIILTELQIDHQIVNVGQRVYGKVVLSENTEYIKSVTLSYLCKWISLSFTEIGWDNYHNSYQYRITGFSEDWQYIDISKPITFSQLPPGNYTLSIRLNDASQTEDAEPVWSLQINITPPWWETGVFYFVLSFIILLVLLSLFFVIKNYYKRRQLQKLEEIEKKKKEELLQEKESFFAGLSHDLLTPFSLIIAPISDLMKDRKINEDQHEKLEIISKNANFLSDVFSTILDLKRAELIDTEIKERNIEIVSFIKIITNAFDYLAKSNEISLSFNSNIPGLLTSIDTIKLERVLYNLISNAFKFTKKGGEVNISLNYDEPREVLSIGISDTGVGIEKKNQKHVFDKFYQEKRSTTSVGLGLGLYTTRKFVHMMGGDMDLQSTPLIGTTITITLPVKKIENTETNSDKNKNYDENTLFSILLVEDNSQLREYLKKRLSSHFNVAVASDGEEALIFIKNNLPEIVISDVMMPGMDGLTLCSEIKNTELYSDIFVILLSAKSSTEDEMLGYKAGADFYIKKPFEPDVLIKQLTNVYSTRQQRRKQIITDLLSPQNNNNESQPKNDFLQRAIKIIEEHLMDDDFKIDDFASEMNLSKTVLHRKFKLIIGETPNIFIRNVRLRKAANMLKETELSISEIAYMTGFSQAHYFIKCFKEVYRDTPKNFRISARQCNVK